MNAKLRPGSVIGINGRMRLILKSDFVRIVNTNDSVCEIYLSEYPRLQTLENTKNYLEEDPVCMYSSISMPSINDIELFYTCRSGNSEEDGRTTNGEKNELRENIIVLLPNLPEQYAQDPRWSELRDKFMRAIREFSPYTNYTFRISKKGGRRFSYDFDFVFTNTDTNETLTRKVEFKNSNTSTIDKIPQVYQKTCNTTHIFADGTELFPEYYYKHGLTQYCATDSRLCEQIPTLEEYTKKCASSESTHPFFVEMKRRRDHNVEAKNAIVNSTIEEYIRGCIDSVQLDKVSAILRETQSDKTYLLWNYTTLEFHIDQIPPEELVITRVATTTKNTIVFQANRYTYHFLLRWKNGKGILNPAWQVSLSVSGH